MVTTEEVATETTGQTLLEANKAAGKTFEKELMEELITEGREVTLNVYKWAPFGARYIDLEVSLNGKVLGGIEAKVGSSRYRPLQRIKDI